MNIIFWQWTQSIHQSAYIRALAELPTVGNVRAVFMESVEPERIAMGWHVPEYGDVSVILSPSPKTIDSLLQEIDDGTIHIFSEFTGNLTIRKILYRRMKDKGIIGLLSEGRDPRGFKGLLRILHSFICERRIAKRADFILTIGHLASDWYLKCGFKPKSMFDFSYVVENINLKRKYTQALDGAFRITFIGGLITRKRVDLLLKALSQLDTRDWELRIIGDGPEKALLEALSEQFKLKDKIHYLGSMDNTDARQELTNSDLLVLPSHWDGWGAVVNEALMCGTRVVCSDYCGAKTLIEGTPWGGIFECDSSESLANALKAQIFRGPVSDEERSAIKQYSHTIAGPSIAAYLGHILEFITGTDTIRPTAPWKDYVDANQ